MTQPFEWSVRHIDGRFEATTPYRAVVWIGESEQEAIGAMLLGMCSLVKYLCLDPDDPYAPGKRLTPAVAEQSAAFPPAHTRSEDTQPRAAVGDLKWKDAPDSRGRWLRIRKRKAEHFFLATLSGPIVNEIVAKMCPVVDVKPGDRWFGPIPEDAP